MPNVSDLVSSSGLVPTPSLPTPPLKATPTEPTGTQVYVPPHLQSLMGPTGRVFQHPGSDRLSTEMTWTFQVGDKYYNVPLLVPGQIGVSALMQGTPPTPEQIRIAIDYMQSQPNVTGYTTENDALTAIRARHQRIEQELQPYLLQQLRGR
jgi:hypothetical protein